MITSSNFYFIRKNIVYNTSFYLQATKKKINYLKFRKRTSESSESGLSCCRRASRTRPVSGKTRSLVVDDTGIQRNGSANHDSFGKIVKCFFHHDKTFSPV
jgi:hypothetical protein